MSRKLFRVLTMVLLFIAVLSGFAYGTIQYGGADPVAADSVEKVLVWKRVIECFAAWDKWLYGTDSAQYKCDIATMARYELIEARPKQAEAHLREALQWFNSHPQRIEKHRVARFQWALGRLLTSSGRYAEGIGHLEHALTYYRQDLPPQERYYYTALDLAVARAHTGDFDRAIALLDDATTAAETAVRLQELEGWNYQGARWKSVVVLCLRTRSYVLWLQSKTNEAAQALAKAADIERANSLYHPGRLDRAYALSIKAQLNASTGNFGDAQKQADEAMNLCARTPYGVVAEGEDLNVAGYCYLKAGNLSEAERLYNQAYSINKKIFGRYDVRTADSLNGLAIVQVLKNDNPVEARRLVNEDLQLRSEIFGEDSPASLRFLRRFQDALKQGRYPDKVLQVCRSAISKLEKRKQDVTVFPDWPVADGSVSQAVEDTIAWTLFGLWMFSNCFLQAELARIIAVRKGRLGAAWFFLTVIFGVIPLIVLACLSGHWDLRRAGGGAPRTVLLSEDPIESDTGIVIALHELLLLPGVVAFIFSGARDCFANVIGLLVARLLFCQMFGALAAYSLTSGRQRIVWTLSCGLAGIVSLVLLLGRLRLQRSNEIPAISFILVVLFLLSDLTGWTAVIYTGLKSIRDYSL